MHPFETQASSTPSSFVRRRASQKRKRDDKEKDFGTQIENLRMERLADWANNITLYANLNRGIDELQKHIVALSKKAENNFVALIYQIQGVRPLASIMSAPTAL